MESFDLESTVGGVTWPRGTIHHAAPSSGSKAKRHALFVAAFTVAFLAGLLWPSAALAAPAWWLQPAPAWVAAVEPAAADAIPISAEAPNGVRYLLFDRQTRVAKEGSVVESYMRWARQITNEAGLAGSSQVSVDFDPTYETLAIHSVIVRRGAETLNRLASSAVKIVQREPNLESQIFDGRQSAVLFLDDLRIGDIVEFAFTIRGTDPTAQGHFTDSFVLGTPAPVVRLHTRLVMSGGRKVRLRVHAPDGDTSPFGAAPITTSEGTEYTWDLRDVRAFIADPEAPSWYVAYPWVQATDFESWDDVAAWASRLFQVKTPSRGSLRDWVESARRASPSQDAFLLRAIRFVQDEIRYVGIETGISRRRPTDPTTVFDRRYGDCKDKAALLVAILEMEGIAATPALVSTTQGHVLDEMAPSGSLFDHAIVRVVASPDRVYWVDATMSLQGGGLNRLRFAPFERALVIGGRTGKLEALESEPVERPSPAIRDRYTVPAPGSSAETTLDSERVYEGETADSIRRQLSGMTAEQITKSFLSTYQGDFSTIHEISPVVQNDDRERNVVRVVLHFAISRFWMLDKHLDRFAVEVTPRVIAGALSRPPSAKRTAPLAVAHPLRMGSVIELDLPFDLAMTPEASVSRDDAFVLRFASTYANRRLTYTYDLTTLSSVVGAADVEPHLERTEKARVSLTRSLTYRTPQAEGFNWASFVAIVGALPFVLFGAYRAYRYEPRASRRAHALPVDPRLHGIGGWLLLLAFGIVINPIANAVGAVQTARAALSLATWRALTTPELATYAPGLAIATIIEAVCLAAFVAYGSVVAVLFFQKRRAFPFHFTLYATGLAAFRVVDLLVAEALLAHGASSTGDSSATSTIRTVAWVVTWVLYVKKSRRAAATFVTRAPRRQRVAPPEDELGADAASADATPTRAA